MKYLFDTNIIVEHLKGKKSIEVSFLRKGSAVSIVTRAELFYGAYRSKRSQENLSKIREMLAELGIETAPLTEEIIDKYGRVKAELERKGQKLDEFDLLIAATALSLNLTLVTSNIKHFQRIPQLKLKL